MNKKVIQQISSEDQPLLVIVGPTASGKSALAMQVAKAFNGELICADSRTIYAGMDIGTAKPSAQDQAEVPHWGLDLVRPGERFTAADFKYFAQHKIAEIRERGHLPIVVGGTGLYVDGLIFDYDFVETDASERTRLESWSIDALHKYCANNNITLPENQQNKRYVIQAILRKNAHGKRLTTPSLGTLVVGIATERSELERRIAARASEMFRSGVIEEAQKLADAFGWESEAMTGNIYPLIRKYVNGELTQAECIERFVIADRQLAKRQMTWFKRNPSIIWKPLDEAYTYIECSLSSSLNRDVLR